MDVKRGRDTDGFQSKKEESSRAMAHMRRENSFPQICVVSMNIVPLFLNRINVTQGL